jgi:hypothetical protein
MSKPLQSAQMKTLAASAPIKTLGLPSGDHWVRFHVEGDVISYDLTTSLPLAADKKAPKRKPTGFVKRWSGCMKKVEDPADPWLAHINEKHLR